MREVAAREELRVWLLVWQRGGERESERERERKMLWVDKHRPKTLDKLVVHSDLGKKLKSLVNEGSCPHLLFYGPPGAGKKTLLLATLREIYGAGVEKLKVECKPWTIERPERNVEVELTTVSSNYHVELTPGDVGNNDRFVVQMIIKEMAKSRPLDVTGQKSFKVVVLNEVDRLSKSAQHSLRRTMEKYSSGCRLFLYCNSLSRVTEAVRSRCMCIRVPAPDSEQVASLLQTVAKKENITLPDVFSGRIAEQARRNMRTALLSLETCKVAKYPFEHNQPVEIADWEAYVKEIAADMVSEQSPKRIYLIRGKLYELLVNCIPPDVILQTLCDSLMAKLDDDLKHEVVFWAAHYERKLQLGSKPIFHLEAFVAKFMMIYKHFLINMFG